MKHSVKSLVRNVARGQRVLLERARLRYEARQLRAEIDQLRADLKDVTAERDKFQLGWPPGHFYSPIPSLEDVKRDEEQIFRVPAHLPDVELNVDGQIALFDQIKRYYPEQPFEDDKKDGLRYFFVNPNYSYGEAIMLYCLMRHLRPKRIVEVGSGYSSCAMLDTNELFLGGSTFCTFIEPYPQLLQSLIKDADHDRIEIVQSRLQDIDIQTFSALSPGDILFIDSTHVSKVNSDVNYIFFEILPRLRSDVYIHIHDICYPFEYPKAWIYQGRAWNEAYLLRAFLQNNHAFEIQFFNSFMGYFHMDMFANDMPLCAKNPGTSLWIKKI